MNTVQIHKAVDIGNVMTIPDCTIIIAESMPESMKFADALANYKEEAEVLGEALINHLPGGTLSALLIKLLQHKADYHRIPNIITGEK